MPRFRVTTTETTQIIARYYVDAPDAETAKRRVRDHYCRPHVIEERSDKDSVAYAVEPSDVSDAELRGLGKPAITIPETATCKSTSSTASLEPSSSFASSC